MFYVFHDWLYAVENENLFDTHISELAQRACFYYQS